MEGGWSGDGDDDGDDLPSAEAKSDSRLALEEEQRLAEAPRRVLEKRLIFRSFPVTGIDRRRSRAPGEGGVA